MVILDMVIDGQDETAASVIDLPADSLDLSKFSCCELTGWCVCYGSCLQLVYTFSIVCQGLP